MTDIIKSGPLVRSVHRDRGGVVVTFTTFGSPLRGEIGSPIGGFEMASSDGIYVEVPAEISSDRTLRIRIPAKFSGRPKAIRYGWRPDPVNANLCNREGLPAATFQMPIASPSPTD